MNYTENINNSDKSIRNHEILLKELISQGNKAVVRASSSLNKGLNDVSNALAYLKDKSVSTRTKI